MFSTLTTQFKNVRVYSALLLGACFGLVLYSYWFVDVLPPTGRAITLITFLATVLGIVGYYLILDRYVAPLLPQVPKASRWAIILGSVLVGGYLAFAYLDTVGVSARYITFLLPRQTLRVSIPTEPNAGNSGIAIVRFATSLGDVSYGALHYRGWTRNGTDLVLTDPSNNQLEWTGRTGEEAVLTFRMVAQGAIPDVSWNGQTEKLTLGPGEDGKYQDTHHFPVPFYSGGVFLLLLGALDLIVICCAANLVIWNGRAAILSSLEQSVSHLLHAGETGQGGRGNAAGSRSLRQDWIIITCLMALALLLRVFNLDRLYPYNDEYSHLLAAKALLQGASLGSVFDRSLLIVTLPVLASVRVFGTELWAARLPGVLFNVLAVIPLFYLTRKINAPVAVLSGLLYATSPWIIAIARNVREYAYYPFYFYWIIYAMVVTLERLPGRLHLFQDWKKLFQPSLMLPGLALLFVLFYAFFLDARSTFKIIVIAYAVFALFLIMKFDLRSKSNLLSLALLAGAALIAGIAYVQAFGHSGMSISPHFRADSLGFFFPNPAQQWYFARPVLVPAAAALAAGAICYWAARHNFIPAFIGALLLASALFFTIFFGYLLLPRYLTIMQLWFVIFLALGVYALLALLLVLPRKDILLPLSVTAVFALSFNIPQSLLPTVYDKQGNNPITMDYHYNLGPAYSFLMDKVSGQDVLLSTVYAGYVRWMGAPQFKKIYSYSFVEYLLRYKGIIPYEVAEPVAQTPQQRIQSVVEGNDSGWIVLDSITYSASVSKPLPLTATIVADKAVDYIGYFGGEYIWRWGTGQPSS